MGIGVIFPFFKDNCKPLCLMANLDVKSKTYLNISAMRNVMMHFTLSNYRY